LDKEALEEDNDEVNSSKQPRVKRVALIPGKAGEQMCAARMF